MRVQTNHLTSLTPAQATLGAPTSAGATEMSTPVSSSRLRKRESDRRSQRQARERMKSRLAYLEGVVDQYRQDSIGDDATVVLKELSEAEREKDAAIEVLQKVWQTMSKYYKRPTAMGPAQVQEARHSDAERTAATMGGAAPGLKAGADGSRGSDLAGTGEPVSQLVDHMSLRSSASPKQRSQPSPLQPETERSQISSPCWGLAATTQQSGDTGCAETPLLEFKPSNYAPNWALSTERCPCKVETGLPISSGNKGHSSWRGNQWTFANEVLGERLTWHEGHIQTATDIECDDVPIRVLLEGWHSVTQRDTLNPTWQIIERIDRTLFSCCPNVERLAILRAMHTLLQFHVEPTQKRYRCLPPWYIPRRETHPPRSYAIEYFAWPGVRERFTQNEHRYCGNEFWSLFCSNLKILWPYQFRDCYVREAETGIYKISPLFDQRLRDICCWTMMPDIFRRFPELSSDIPVFNSIPTSLSYNPQQEVEARLSETVRLITGWSYPESKLQRAHCIVSGVETATIDISNEDEAIKSPMMAQGVAALTQPSEQEPALGEYEFSDFNPITTIDAFVHGIADEADLELFYASCAEG